MEDDLLCPVADAVHSTKNPNFKEIQTLCRYADKYGIVQKKSLDFFLFMLQSFMIELEVSNYK